MLAKINWTFFVKREQFDDSMSNLISCIRNDVNTNAVTSQNAAGKDDVMQEDDDVDDEAEEEGDATSAVSHAPMGIFGKLVKYCRQLETCQVFFISGSKSTQIQDSTEATDVAVCEHTNDDVKADFWIRHFESQKQVEWAKIEEAFLSDYRQAIVEDFGEERMNFLVRILHRDIFERRSVITKLNYNKFVGRNGSNPRRSESQNVEEGDRFYDRLRHYASSSLALREVLDMNSTVRLTAIETLGERRVSTPRTAANTLKLKISICCRAISIKESLNPPL